jgi:hypothetical protein
MTTVNLDNFWQIRTYHGKLPGVTLTGLNVHPSELRCCRPESLPVAGSPLDITNVTGQDIV